MTQQKEILLSKTLPTGEKIWLDKLECDEEVWYSVFLRKRKDGASACLDAFVAKEQSATDENTFEQIRNTKLNQARVLYYYGVEMLRSYGADALYLASLLPRALTTYADVANEMSDGRIEQYAKNITLPYNWQ